MDKAEAPNKEKIFYAAFVYVAILNKKKGWLKHGKQVVSKADSCIISALLGKYWLIKCFQQIQNHTS